MATTITRYNAAVEIVRDLVGSIEAAANVHQTVRAERALATPRDAADMEHLAVLLRTGLSFLAARS